MCIRAQFAVHLEMKDSFVKKQFNILNRTERT